MHSLRPMWRTLPLLLVLTLVCAERHHDLHRALKQHSSLESAAHRGDVHKTDLWTINPGHVREAETLVQDITRHLTAGAVVLERAMNTGLWVLRASDTVDPNELTTLLMSEQRGGRIEWFHRDGLAHRKSH